MAFTILLSYTQYLVVSEWCGTKAKGGKRKKEKHPT